MVRKLAILILITAFTFTSMLLVLADPEQKTVEGQGYYFNTGESYPTSIAITGYNSRDKILYVNTELQTTKIVGVNQTADFKYIIEVYNRLGALIGSLGTFDLPIAQPAALGQNTVKISNMSINLTLPLTAQNRVVVTVKNVEIF